MYRVFFFLHCSNEDAQDESEAKYTAYSKQPRNAWYALDKLYNKRLIVPGFYVVLLIARVGCGTIKGDIDLNPVGATGTSSV